MPKPDKTKLTKWDFDSFKQHETEGAVYYDLKELPKEIDRIINVENTENLVIQHNNTLAYTKVNEKAQQDGVIIEHIQEALVNHSDLVEKYFMKDAVTVDEHRLTALHTALMNGVFSSMCRKMLLLNIRFNMLCFMTMTMQVSSTMFY